MFPFHATSLALQQSLHLSVYEWLCASFFRKHIKGLRGWCGWQRASLQARGPKVDLQNQGEKAEHSPRSFQSQDQGGKIARWISLTSQPNERLPKKKKSEQFLSNINLKSTYGMHKHRHQPYLNPWMCTFINIRLHVHLHVGACVCTPYTKYSPKKTRTPVAAHLRHPSSRTLLWFRFTGCLLSVNLSRVTQYWRRDCWTDQKLTKIQYNNSRVLLIESNHGTGWTFFHIKNWNIKCARKIRFMVDRKSGICMYSYFCLSPSNSRLTLNQ